ncbi:bone morphogenetic protein 4-like isoform X1 [Vespula maculifrons]|uniref:Bone morphogenetic protein 4-like isoform X1 n=1 Tax=Vespula maculifrons TaxID=7453 RepID=A0ABD2CHG8_VESMC
MQTRSALSLLLVMSAMSSSMHLLLPEADAYPSDLLKDDKGQERTGPSLSLSELTQGNELGNEKHEDELEKLQKIFGIRGQGEKSAHRKIPPQFMMELYNTIADDSGVTRGRNPYNAKVVRSFVERDTSLSHFYFFNVSGLEVNESVLEAELHLYRKKTPTKTVHPSTLTSPYYLIRVYQVLDERSLAVPSLHKLLNIHYAGVHTSGWQVFNVKEAVLSWVSGDPNLGLLVTVTTLFDDEVNVEFSRRNEYHHNKQPILVLFDDDGKEQRSGMKIVPDYYTYGNDNIDEDELRYDGVDDKIDLEEKYDEHLQRQKRQRGEPEDSSAIQKREKEFFSREKRKHEESDSAWREDSVERDRRDTKLTRKRPKKIISHRTKMTHVLTSMDIYERAMLREKLNKVSQRANRTQRRERRSTKEQSPSLGHKNTTVCSRHELYVDFKEIGLSSSIIAPKGYSAYHCKGLCESPLSQDQQPTNHATVQGIVHKMGLVKGVEMPCCVPTKLLSTSILFFDDNENVVLKMYEDMIADRCGCR